MWPDPLHPALVHFPIVLALFAPVIAAALLWAIETKKVPAPVWLGVVILQLVLFGAGWGVAETGEDEEERVERVVAEELIEEHEEAAERFLWLAGLTIPIAVVGLLAGPLGKGARVVTVVACVAGAVSIAQVGHLGGELVYRHGAANAYLDAEKAAGADSPASPSVARERTHHD